MNRTLRTLPVGVLLVVLTACTSGAPTGATLPPLTTTAVTTGSTAPSAGAAGPTTDPTTEAPTSESESSVVAETPVDVTVPPEASALPLPTEQVDIPADNPQEEADRAAIEAVWRQFWDLYRDGYDMSEAKIREAAALVLAEPLKTQVVNGLLLPESRIATATGNVLIHPYWYESVNGSRYAVMGDCLDYSNMTIADKGTGDNLTRGSSNIDSVGHFIRDDDGAWRVWQLTTVTGSSCSA